MITQRIRDALSLWADDGSATLSINIPAIDGLRRQRRPGRSFDVPDAVDGPVGARDALLAHIDVTVATQVPTP